MATPIVLAQFRWQRSHIAEPVASDRASAACYRRPENIGVVAVVVAEFEFSNVQAPEAAKASRIAH
jgi:hypothetical protein